MVHLAPMGAMMGSKVSANEVAGEQYIQCTLVGDWHICHLSISSVYFQAAVPDSPIVGAPERIR